MLTIVMAYYENPGMLQMQCAEWRRYDRQFWSQISVVIVDDGSQDHHAKDVLAGADLPLRSVKLFRVDKDIPWNQDGARNLGMRNVEDEWALLTDMDHMLDADQVSGALLRCQNTPVGMYLMPIRKQQWTGTIANPHPNSYLIRVGEFWDQGGYDEDFAGVYGSDGNFRKCMRAGLTENMTQEFYLTQYRREEFPDSGTNRYSRKQGPYYRANFPHLEAKTRGPAYKAVNHVRFPWHQESI